MTDQPPKRETRTAKFIGDLADRSAGLPRGKKTSSQEADNAERNQLLRLGGLGIQFGASVILFLLLGLWIDRHFGWNFVATVTLLCLALVGNFYLLIKDTMKINK